jgi:hypothetical protein
MSKHPSAESKRLREQLKSTQIAFLLTDLQIGITFAKMAMESSKEEIRTKTTRKARRAYDIVLRFLSTVGLKQAEEKEIGEELASLKLVLQSLGEAF